MPKIKAVIDTNIFISGLLGGKTARAIINALIARKFILVLSDDLLNELINTVAKPKIAGLIPAGDSAILAALLEDLALFPRPSKKIDLCRDIEDNKVLEVAQAAGADMIVTGDKDLISLHAFDNIEIMTPAAFLKRLKEK